MIFSVGARVIFLSVTFDNVKREENFIGVAELDRLHRTNTRPSRQPTKIFHQIFHGSSPIGLSFLVENMLSLSKDNLSAMKNSARTRRRVSWVEEQEHSSATTIVSTRTTKDKWPVHWVKGRTGHKTLLSSSIECNQFFLFARQGKQKKRFARQANKLPTIVSSEDTERSDSARWICVPLGEWSKWPSPSFAVCLSLSIEGESVLGPRTTSFFSWRSGEVALVLPRLRSCSI